MKLFLFALLTLSHMTLAVAQSRGPLETRTKLSVNEQTLNCYQGGNPRSGTVINISLKLTGNDSVSAYLNSGLTFNDCLDTRRQILIESKLNGGFLFANIEIEHRRQCGGSRAPDACVETTSRSVTLLDRSGRSFEDLGSME